MSFQHITVPAKGEKITSNADFSLNVPDMPVIPFVEGDGIGADITPVMKKVINAAVAKAYGSKREIQWMEIYAGEKANALYGGDVWLPDETIDVVKDYVVSIKGPLTTPVGGGMRSLNVTLRQTLDLYTCLRPVRYYTGTPSPVKEPEKTDMVIFRENSEDIYAGIEWEAGSPEVKKMIDFLQNEMGVTKIRFPETSGIGIKPVSREGTERLVRKALQYAIDNNRKVVTIVHKGNIMGERFEGNIRKSDLRRDTPYNTYTRKGLTPTPIATPSAEAIRAVLHPEATKALYFVARGDGTSHFSNSYKEHRRAVVKYQLNGNAKAYQGDK